MANIPIWPGSSSFTTGSTPFGFYDNDADFQTDADKAATFMTQRMGYPIVDIELQDINFYTAFEQAVTTYGNELYSYKVRDNQLSLEGMSTGSTINNTLVKPNFETIVQLSEMYGTEAGAGGIIPYYSGSVPAVCGVQTYDLKAWAEASASIDPNHGIEIKRVFWQGPSALNRFYDPYAGTGFGNRNMLDSLGFGGMSPAINFLMMPLSYDLQVMNSIELNDQVRRSNFSFQLRDNKLKVFPIPLSDGTIWFEYIKREDRINSSLSNVTSSITDVSNTPYANPTYSLINSIGRSWIFEYSLAIAKEILGYVRGKYTSIPIPGDEVNLGYSDLLQAAKDEQAALIDILREKFDETSRKALLERRSEETDNINKELRNVPFRIYIG